MILAAPVLGMGMAQDGGPTGLAIHGTKLAFERQPILGPEANLAHGER
jgi:hypothetical protein